MQAMSSNPRVWRDAEEYLANLKKKDDDEVVSEDGLTPDEWGDDEKQ